MLFERRSHQLGKSSGFNHAARGLFRREARNEQRLHSKIPSVACRAAACCEARMAAESFRLIMLILFLLNMKPSWP